MEFTVEKNRISKTDETGKAVAEILFPAIDANTVDITHTFVDPSLAGQGIAGQLVASVVKELRQSGRQAKLTCSYAVKWCSQHAEAADVLKK